MHVGAVDLEPESPRQHLLPGDLQAGDIGRQPVDDRRLRKLCQLVEVGRKRTRVDDPRNGDRLNARDRELRHTLHEPVSGHVVVRPVVPLRAEVEVV